VPTTTPVAEGAERGGDVPKDTELRLVSLRVEYLALGKLFLRVVLGTEVGEVVGLVGVNVVQKKLG